MKPTLLLLLPALASFCHGDTFKLKNGTALEGTILSEESDHYVAMIQYSRTIREQRKILKSDVIEIIEEQKDVIEFEKIKPLIPTPDLLSPEEYERRIETINAFLTAHSTSPLVPQATEILKQIEAEASEVSAGGIKIQGTLIPAAERSAKAFTLDSRIAANQVLTFGKAGDRTSALRAWDTLKKEFPTSQAYKDTVPFITKLIETHRAAIEKSLSTIDARIEKRKEGIELIPAKDRARTRNMLEEGMNHYLELIDREREAKIRWVTLNPFQKQPMIQTLGLLNNEANRIKSSSSNNTPDGDKAWADAWKVLSNDPSPEDARQAISDARNGRLPEKYMDQLRAMVPEQEQ